MLISAQNVNGLSNDEIIEILKQSIKGRPLNNVLIIPPDITRFHSKAGFITNCCYHLLREKGVHVDILPALGTHAPMSEAELDKMFGDIPKELFMVHHWRDDVIKISTVNRYYINEISEGIFEEDIAVEVNKLWLVAIIFICIVEHISITSFQTKTACLLHFCIRQAVIIIRNYTGSVIS